MRTLLLWSVYTAGVVAALLALGQVPSAGGDAAPPARAGQPFDGRWVVVICLIAAGSAGLAARWFVSTRRDRWFAGIVVVTATAPIAWWCLRMGVGAGQIEAWFGPAAPGWPGDLAYIMRFLVVYCAGWATCCLAALFALFLAEGTGSAHEGEERTQTPSAVTGPEEHRNRNDGLRHER